MRNGTRKDRHPSLESATPATTAVPFGPAGSPGAANSSLAFVRRIGARNWLEAAGLFLLLLAWYKHSTTVTALNQRLANWESFVGAAASADLAGLPDGYFELHLTVAGSPLGTTALNYAGRYFYEPVWDDINVKRAWGRLMSKQYMWASQIEDFLFRQTPDGSPELRFARELHRALETYDAEWARSFRGREFDPTFLSSVTAARLNTHVVALRNKAADLSQLWAEEVRRLRQQRLRSYSQLYLLGSVLVITSRLISATSGATAKSPRN